MLRRLPALDGGESQEALDDLLSFRLVLPSALCVSLGLRFMLAGCLRMGLCLSLMLPSALCVSLSLRFMLARGLSVRLCL